MSSGCRCSSTDWPGWNGGSNQNHRSAGNSAFIRTSAIRNRSRKLCPRTLSPSALRTALPRPIRRDQILPANPIRPLRRSTVSITPSARVLHPRDPVPPPDLHPRQRPRPLEQEPLHVILLQIDERWPLMSRLCQQIEPIQFALPQEHPPGIPPDAFADHRSPHPNRSNIPPASVWQTDRPRPRRQPIVIIEHHHRHTLQRQIDRHRQPHRPAARHDHLMPHRRRSILVPTAPIREHRRLIIGLRHVRHDRPPQPPIPRTPAPREPIKLPPRRNLVQGGLIPPICLLMRSLGEPPAPLARYSGGRRSRRHNKPSGDITALTFELDLPRPQRSFAY